MSVDKILHDEKVSESEADICLKATLSLCSEKEKLLLDGIAQAIIANRNSES